MLIKAASALPFPLLTAMEIRCLLIGGFITVYRLTHGIFQIAIILLALLLRSSAACVYYMCILCVYYVDTMCILCVYYVYTMCILCVYFMNKLLYTYIQDLLHSYNVADSEMSTLKQHLIFITENYYDIVYIHQVVYQG